jgi:hypothetical protein
LDPKKDYSEIEELTHELFSDTRNIVSIGVENIKKRYGIELTNELFREDQFCFSGPQEIITLYEDAGTLVRFDLHEGKKLEEVALQKGRIAEVMYVEPMNSNYLAIGYSDGLIEIR